MICRGKSNVKSLYTFEELGEDGHELGVCLVLAAVLFACLLTPSARRRRLKLLVFVRLKTNNNRICTASIYSCEH